jgi:hypothetical protein
MLLLFPFCDDCSDSLVDFSWDSAPESDLEFSLESPSIVTLGVGSLIGSINNWSNGTFAKPPFSVTVKLFQIFMVKK